MEDLVFLIKKRMLGTLNDAQIEKLLTSNFIGRIGCHAYGKTYVVPVSYAYKDDCIYVHTFEGLKLSMMRQNPEVCFEVENLEDMGNWQSVISWGTFKELTEPAEIKEGLKVLVARKFTGITSETVRLGNLWPFTNDSLEDIKGVVIRILLSEKTGRFENMNAQIK